MVMFSGKVPYVGLTRVLVGAKVLVWEIRFVWLEYFFWGKRGPPEYCRFSLKMCLECYF